MMFEMADIISDRWQVRHFLKPIGVLPANFKILKFFRVVPTPKFSKRAFEKHKMTQKRKTLSFWALQIADVSEWMLNYAMIDN